MLNMDRRFIMKQVLYDHESSNNERIKKIKMNMAVHDHNKTKLAEILGLSLPAVSFKLNGKRPWTVKELEVLSLVYNQDISYFFD